MIKTVSNAYSNLCKDEHSLWHNSERSLWHNSEHPLWHKSEHSLWHNSLHHTHLIIDSMEPVSPALIPRLKSTSIQAKLVTVQIVVATSPSKGGSSPCVIRPVREGNVVVSVCRFVLAFKKPPRQVLMHTGWVE